MSAWRAWYESWLQAIRITSRGKGSEKIGIVSPEYPSDKPAKVVDLMGNERALEPKGRILALELQAGTPVFVLLEK